MRSRVSRTSVPLIVEGVDPYMDEPDLGSECRWLQHTAAMDQHGGIRQRANGSHAATLVVAISTVLASSIPTSRSRATSTCAPGKRIELRVETFNLFNTVNWSNPNVTVGSATAGRITIDSQRSTHHAVCAEVRVLARAPHYQRPGLTTGQAWSRHLREFNDL